MSVHIRCCGHGRLGFRSYSGSLLANAPKVTKRSSPHHSAPRLGSVCPHSGFGAWAAAMGHPWPSAANPASCRVTHAPKPAFGQRGFTGRLRSKSRAKAERGGLRTDRVFEADLGHLWELACLRRHQLDMPDSPRRPHRSDAAIRQASSHRKATYGAQKTAFAPHHSSRLSGRCAFAFDVDFDLRRPPNPCRITGTPSLGEVPSVGARALCLLWGFSKVSRRKGGTIISRYRSNGYVHLQKGPTP
ncbi:hypothetical protein [Pseudomonas sp. 24 E 1]|nr:hypothetical protein [Pseudomonas sp. 24 E 1]